MRQGGTVSVFRIYQGGENKGREKRAGGEARER